MKSLERNKLILIGASTGGPAHIEKILAALAKDFNATIIIAQHMGHEFIPSFAKRLNERSKLEVVQAQHQESIHNNKVFIVSQHAKLLYAQGNLTFDISPNPDAHFNPDINTLFLSATEITQKYDILAVILTGIGDDGATGCVMLEEAGAICIAESQKTAVVYGMPARTKERGKNILIKDLYEIIEIIKQFGA